jgi:Na+/melibiose symporter-like transporter
MWLLCTISSWAFAVTHQNNHPSMRLSMLIIATGTISTSLAQPDLLDLPIRHLLKDELHVSQAQMAMLFGIGALAWYVKPLAGLLVDSVALFGTRRRHYLIISALAASALWLLLGIVSYSYSLLLVTVVAMQFMLVIGSTVLGGFLVEKGKLLGAEGRLVSCRIFVEHACILVAGPLAGYLAGLPFGTAALIGAAIAAMTAPIVAVCVAEPVQEERKIITARHLFRDLSLVLNSRVMWLVAIFSLVSNIPQSFGTPLYFYQKNVLALSDLQIGYLTAAGGIGGLLASIFYQFLCRKLLVKGLLILGTLGPSIGILAYLFYTSVPAALIVELLGGFVFGIGTLAFMQSAVISTLVPSAAFGFALLMSASNAGDAIGDVLAALLVERLSITLFDLVKLFAVASAACCLFVFVLPRGLLNHREGKPIVSIGL